MFEDWISADYIRQVTCTAGINGVRVFHHHLACHLACHTCTIERIFLQLYILSSSPLYHLHERGELAVAYPVEFLEILRLEPS
jgi:hypothetical protein